MNPARKRKIRLVVALGAALCLAGLLVYTSFSASSEAAQPSELREGQSYDLTGKVVPGSIEREGKTVEFEVSDRKDPSASIPVTYSGTVPDPFRAGREIILTGEVQNGTFVGERDTLITKCPSKFTEERSS